MKTKKKKKKKTLTFERVNELLSYDPETGLLQWKVSKGWNARAGQEAGCVYRLRRNSYRLIGVDGVIYYAHRLAWLLTYGEWPSKQIDHIDGNGLNNRIANLRNVTNSENRRNSRMQQDNTSGVVGVYWYKNYRKWRCSITVEGRKIHLGCFDSFEDAAAVRREAEQRYGFAERHGKAEAGA